MAIAEAPPCAAAAPTACDHCGLPVPAGLVEPGAGRQFCCAGCRTAWAVIREHGLDRYYDLARDGPSEAAVPARATGRTYDELDDPTFERLWVRPASGGLASVELYLEGVHCAACVWLVERLPAVVPGVVEARLELGRSLARVVWDPRTTRLAAIGRGLDSLGYPVHPWRGARVAELRRREDRALLVRIAVAGAVAGNVMTMAFALYGGMLHGIEAEYATLFRRASLIVSLPAVTWAAAVFYRGAWGSIRARALHMDVPITIGILAGTAQGAWNALRGAGEIYFDSVTALIFLLLVGRWVQRRRQRAAADAAELVDALAPSAARYLDDDGTVREVPVEALVPGVRVDVRAGDSFPVDGTVLRGRSSVDASLLTGESRPQPVAEGDPVHAGTTNLDAPLEVRVEAAGEATRVARLARLVEEAASRRAPVVRLADRISGAFVAVVLALAALTLALWWSAGPDVAVGHAIALLVVTCPCALGLATPLAVAAAMGSAGRRGILIKGADALERLAAPGRILLDKTGTLTLGRTALVRWSGSAEARAWVAAVEAGVAHPAARALVEGLAVEIPPPATDVARAPDGRGVTGRVGGRAIAVGSVPFAERRAGPLPPEHAANVDACVAEGLSPVVVVVDGRVVAVAGLGDPLREDARATIDDLRGRGFRVGILSGDDPRIVAAVAARLGVAPDDAIGGADPERKLCEVEAAAAAGPVVMVGDGVNDAAALGAATVGVAVHGGAEAALAVADVYLARDGIGALAALVGGARRTLGVIRRNLAFSLAYNAAGAALAMAGWIDPLVAAVLMPASSLTVITHSYRARTF